METANGTIVRVEPRVALARPLEFSPEQRQMIRDTFANGASDAEFAVLMEVAKARNLNPLLRQIFFVQRWDTQKGRMVWACQVSIDGLRAVAERTGRYDGQGEPAYEYDKDGKVKRCTVHVYRKDWSPGRSAVGVAIFEEYAQRKKDGGLTQFWAGKPHVMLAKCAEALALRKAFPEDTSDLYVPEEMDADEAPAQPTQSRTDGVKSHVKSQLQQTKELPPAPWALIQTIGKEAGIGDEQLKTIAKAATGKQSAKELTREDVAKIESAIADLKSEPDGAEEPGGDG